MPWQTVGGTWATVGGSWAGLSGDPVDPVDPDPDPDPVQTVLEEGDGLVTVTSLAEMPGLTVTAGDELVTVEDAS